MNALNRENMTMKGYIDSRKENLIQFLPKDLHFAVKKSTPSNEKRVIRQIKSRLQIPRSFATEIFASVKKFYSVSDFI